MKTLKFSFAVGLIISFMFLLITFWIFYAFARDANAAKDALSTTGSYFGAVATLGAAIIAAYLFNDWRDQQNHQSQKEFILAVIQEHKNIAEHTLNSIRFMRKAIWIYSNSAETLPQNHRELIFEFFDVQNELTRLFMRMKVEIQNYGIISNDINFSLELRSLINKEEEIIDNLFAQIKSNLKNQDPTFFAESIENYNNKMGLDLSGTLYEIVVMPLLNRIPAQ